MMQEQSRERELMDLREDIEALKAKHQEAIDAANSKIVLQKWVKKLLEHKTAFENDEIKEKFSYLSASVPFDRRLQSPSSANDLRQEKTQLRNLVSSLGSENT